MELEAKTLIKGGEFIIKDSRPEDIFTPEDFSEEQIMMKESVQEFIDREVWPHKERFEKKRLRIHKTVYAKGWRAWLSRCLRSRKLWRNGHGLCIHNVGL